ncbi:molybdopterin-dependent oxidoreductase [Planotetraspora mira]|uniref:Nitrate reductase catalytic subunit n=1 Tax=Planotetraspora mira TaxID=58121 RepID=A0A8J3TU90_9ACTN|nr:molybdopterin-dependent oxidoreductase [Planotetraspora mira]GII32236.1 nitrate reductase catalytic subunit [Planotetraspora mira]
MPEPIADHGGRRTPYGPPGGVERLAAALPGRLRDALPAEIGVGSPWPVRVDTYLDEGVTEADVDVWVQNVSAVQSSGDALDIAVRDGRIVGVRGRGVDRVNHGRIDPRDRHGPSTAGDGTRLTRPMIREDGRLVECDWDTAMGRIAGRSKELLEAPGGWGRLGFYTGGRLLLEEHYTLAVIAKAGIATPHVDGSTRVGDATAAAALTASFGADGQPGSYTDVDHCDAIALWGQDMAESRVVWERMLDRRLGPRPPAMIAVDPQETQVAKEADVHLPVRSGTNVALMNALLHELIAGNRYDAAYVARHTLGFAELCRVVEAYPPKRAAEICAVPAALIEQAAEILGSCERLVSTVLPGFYRSNQATAAACQVNNLHLLRGMLGRPGAGLFQMTGRPAGQHARETGASGELPGMRNWENPDHVRELAELWNVDLAAIPHWGPPTHAMQIFRYAEQGSIRLLWISAADPVVSLPHADRVSKVLGSEELFLVVQDLYLTETARLADVVLPAAGWGEKPGTVTGADRTVHLCERAVEPPGEARADLDIFLDYARRMGFRDRDGAPLIGWHDAESAFEAWKACSKGRPCDCTGITYDRLRGGSGVQWPCTPSTGHGAERLYAGGRFATDPGVCQSFGHDLATGAEWGAECYCAKEPHGRAFLHAAHYEPSSEAIGDGRPLYWDPVSKQPIYSVATYSVATVPVTLDAVPDTETTEVGGAGGGAEADGVVPVEVSQRLEEV